MPREINRHPVVMRPENEPVGWVRSEWDADSGPARFVAADLLNAEIGTFASYEEAADALIQPVRQSRGQRYWQTTGANSTYHAEDGTILGRVERVTVLRSEGDVTRFIPRKADGTRLNAGYGSMTDARTLVESSNPPRV